MTSIAVKLITLVVAVTLPASMANAITGAQLEKHCSSWTVDIGTASQNVGAGKTYASLGEFRDAVFCQGFVVGYAVGIKGTMGADDKGVMGTYTIEKGVTGSQLVKVFTQYIANHPEEENKPSGDVLYHAMTGSGLLTIVTEQK